MSAETNVLHYTARLRGLPLLDVVFCLHTDAGAYQAGLTARTLGLAEFLAHGRSTAHADGAIDGSAVTPHAFAEHGRLSGEDHAVAIDYVSGNPVLRLLAPPEEKDRLPVTQADLLGSIDGLSAVTLEALVATRTGACQGRALVYDGRQLRRATTHTAGHEVLPPSARNVFAGDALRCDTESVMLAGFIRNEQVRAQTRPRYSKSWLAPVAPGGSDVLVRLAFDADILGDIVVDLDGVSHADSPVCTGKS